jgi:hypothetical protein
MFRAVLNHSTREGSILDKEPSKAPSEDVTYSRKPYEKPELKEFGDVRTLTMNGGPSRAEGSSGKLHT